MDESDCGGRASVIEKGRDDDKVIVKLAPEGASFWDWNPIQLTKSINKETGEERTAEILRNVLLLIICKDGGRRGRAVRMSKINSRKVLCSLTNDRKWVRGCKRKFNKCKCK